MLPQRHYILLIIILIAGSARGDEWKTLLDLKGEWKIELGDNARWSDPTYDDSKWDNISVPAPWEDEGFPGYDGYAWYRKHFTLQNSLKDNDVYLHLGYVDDVSEIYLNGHMIALQGEFPPNFATAYDVYQQHAVPQQFLNNTGDNVIAVRVYDQRLGGGITHGRIGLYEPQNGLKLDLQLAGIWQFTTGDNGSWKEPSANDASWKKVVVPGHWETQGFKDYDGFGWYRIKFKVPANLIGQRLILLLGKIDDVDETYLNGELVGKTGVTRKGMDQGDAGNSWQEFRAYVIPSDLLLLNQDNTLAVRVNDVYLGGGIYDGPIGLISRDKYLKWKKDQDDEWRSLFDWFK